MPTSTTLDLVETLVAAELIDQDKQKEILDHEDLAPFFTREGKKSLGEKKPQGKKKTPDPSERDGKVDEDKCLARIWMPKPGAPRVSAYDNVQCSVKRVEGLGCFCRVHYAKDLACKKIDGLSGLPLGIVTEEKPEQIMIPTKWDNETQEYKGGFKPKHSWSDSVVEPDRGEPKAVDIWSLGC